jgi:hypothetical protein
VDGFVVVGGDHISPYLDQGLQGIYVLSVRGMRTVLTVSWMFVVGGDHVSPYLDKGLQEVYVLLSQGNEDTLTHRDGNVS